MNLELHNNKSNKGRGFWKFDNDLLHDKEFVELIKKTIIESKKNIQSQHRQRPSMGTSKT